MMTPTVDLRGSGSPAYGAVLADPSGRRAARLRRLGLAVAVVFLLWLFGLVLAGLGLIPLSDLPLGQVVDRSAQPPELPASTHPAPPKQSDLAPARPAATPAAVHATRAQAGAPADGAARRPAAASQPAPAQRRGG